jgi:hypothetical protein
MDSYIRLFVEDCKIYRKIINKNDIEKLRKQLNTLGECAVENGMKINTGNIMVIGFTGARFKNPMPYSLGDQKIPKVSICKYFGIILQSDLNWMDQVNYTVQKA